MIAALGSAYAAYRRAVEATVETSPGTRVLPFHVLLIESAKAYLERDEYRVAVMMAQTAVEVLIEQVITEELRKQTTSLDLAEWVLDRSKPFALQNASASLYVLLTGDEIQRQDFWDRYARHVKRRHGVVHRGEDVERSLAEESVDVARKVIRHVDQGRTLRNGPTR